MWWVPFTIDFSNSLPLSKHGPPSDLGIHGNNILGTPQLLALKFLSTTEGDHP